MSNLRKVYHGIANEGRSFLFDKYRRLKKQGHKSIDIKNVLKPIFNKILVPPC